MSRFLAISEYEVRQFDLEFVQCSQNFEAMVENMSERFSADKKAGYTYIANAYNEIELHPAFINYVSLDDKFVNLFAVKDKLLTVGSFINSFHRLGLAIQYITEKAEELKHPALFDDNDNVHYKEILFFYVDTMMFNLMNVRRILEIKHLRRNGRKASSYDFCCLCWRRTRLHETNNEFRNRRSHFYCDYHSPSKENTNYKVAINALFAAIKREKNAEFSKNIDQYNNRFVKELTGLPGIYERWFRAFRRRSYFREGENFQKNGDWKGLARGLIDTAKRCYPITYERIKDSLNESPRSWKHWVIFGVISKLDDKNGSEALYWQNDKVEDWATIEDWEIILPLFSRYDAYHYIQSTKPRVGRPGSLKNEVKEYIVSFINEHGAFPPTDVVCKMFNVTKSTVSKAKKEI